MIAHLRRLWRLMDAGIIAPRPIVKPDGWSRRDFLRAIGVTTMVNIGGLGLLPEPQYVIDFVGVPLLKMPRLTVDDMMRSMLEQFGMRLCEPPIPGFGDPRLMPSEQFVRAEAARLGVLIKE